MAKNPRKLRPPPQSSVREWVLSGANGVISRIKSVSPFAAPRFLWSINESGSAIKRFIGDNVRKSCFSSLSAAVIFAASFGIVSAQEHQLCASVVAGAPTIANTTFCGLFSPGGNSCIFRR